MGNHVGLFGDEADSRVAVDCGRVWDVSRAWFCLRLRGVPILHGCHWLGEHVLCGGSECPACRSGVPKRSFSFWWCDSPREGSRVLRATPSDAASCEQGANAAGLTFEAGLSFMVARPVAKRPLAFERFGISRGVAPAAQDIIMRSVLALHGVVVPRLDATPAEFTAALNMKCARVLHAQGRAADAGRLA